MKRILIVPALLMVWSLWESAVRIILHHNDWDPANSLAFQFSNLSPAVVVGLLLMILILPLLLLFRMTGVRQKPSLVPNLFVSIAGKVFRPILLVSLMVFPVLLTAGLQMWRSSKPYNEARNGIPYIILISIDTLRHDYVSAYGAQNVKTPVIDRIAAEGALFETAISSIPQTGPSHISMLTGRPPLSHGVLFNGYPVPRSGWTATRHLRDAGYRTFGVISGYPLQAENSGLDEGFQQYSDNLSFRDKFRNSLAGKLLSKSSYFLRGVYIQAPEVTEKTLNWLENNSDRPFFIFVHFYDVHYPYGEKATAKFRKHPLYIHAKREELEKQKRLYAKEVETVDFHIGKIVAFLKKKGIYDQTLLAVTADHGESLGEHRYFYNHDHFVYEPLIRVPLIMRCPPLVKRGLTVKSQVQVLDVHTTLLAAAGLSPAPGATGENLIRLAHNGPQNYARPALSHNMMDGSHGLRAGEWKLIRNDRFVEMKHAKDIHPGFELYNLIQDPNELNNIYSAEQQMAILLKQKLDALLASMKGPMNVGKPEDLDPEKLETLKSLGYFN